MSVIDISQEIFSCRVYPGDPAPACDRLMRMEDGALYNLSAFSMCVHNGTHLDAPAHFFKDGKTIGDYPPEVFTGDCYVARHTGDVLAEDAQRILAEAAAGLQRHGNLCEVEVTVVVVYVGIP